LQIPWIVLDNRRLITLFSLQTQTITCNKVHILIFQFNSTAFMRFIHAMNIFVIVSAIQPPLLQLSTSYNIRDDDRKLQLLEAKRNVALLQGESTEALDYVIWQHKQNRQFYVKVHSGMQFEK